MGNSAFNKIGSLKYIAEYIMADRDIDKKHIGASNIDRFRRKIIRDRKYTCSKLNIIKFVVFFFRVLAFPGRPSTNRRD